MNIKTHIESWWQLAYRIEHICIRYLCGLILEIACALRYTTAIKLLLRLGADPNIQGIYVISS